MNELQFAQRKRERGVNYSRGPWSRKTEAGKKAGVGPNGMAYGACGTDYIGGHLVAWMFSIYIPLCSKNR